METSFRLGAGLRNRMPRTCILALPYETHAICPYPWGRSQWEYISGRWLDFVNIATEPMSCWCHSILLKSEPATRKTPNPSKPLQIYAGDHRAPIGLIAGKSIKHLPTALHWAAAPEREKQNFQQSNNLEYSCSHAECCSGENRHHNPDSSMSQAPESLLHLPWGPLPLAALGTSMSGQGWEPTRVYRSLQLPFPAPRRETLHFLKTLGFIPQPHHRVLSLPRHQHVILFVLLKPHHGLG